MATTETFNSTTTWTAPSGVTAVKVECLGGGGGGGAHTRGEGGGGGGAYARLNALTIVPGRTYDVTVGAAGAVATAGGDTWFSTSSTVLAKGGSPGSSGTTAGGTGGQAASCIGDVAFNGGTGGDGVSAVPGGGGGGGAGGGSEANGGNGSSGSGGTGGAGGTPGSSPGGAGGAGGTSVGAGTAGTAPGGGGGGGSDGANAAAGAAGRVILTYSVPQQLRWSEQHPLPWLRIVRLAWRVTDAGTLTEYLDGRNGPSIDGFIMRAVTVPDFTDTPTANYDIALKDELGADVLNGLLANRSATAVESEPIQKSVGTAHGADRTGYGRLSLEITNAGVGKAGVIGFYVLSNP